MAPERTGISATHPARCSRSVVAFICIEQIVGDDVTLLDLARLVERRGCDHDLGEVQRETFRSERRRLN